MSLYRKKKERQEPFKQRMRINRWTSDFAVKEMKSRHWEQRQTTAELLLHYLQVWIKKTIRAERRGVERIWSSRPNFRWLWVWQKRQTKQEKRFCILISNTFYFNSKNSPEARAVIALHCFLLWWSRRLFISLDLIFAFTFIFSFLSNYITSTLDGIGIYIHFIGTLLLSWVPFICLFHSIGFSLIILTLTWTRIYNQEYNCICTSRQEAHLTLPWHYKYMVTCSSFCWWVALKRILVL